MIRTYMHPPRRRIDWLKLIVWLGVIAYSVAVYALAGVGVYYLCERWAEPDTDVIDERTFGL